MIAATVCTFRRDEESQWESGIAIVSEPGLHDVIAILPHDSTSRADVLAEVHNYRLLWHEGTMVLPKSIVKQDKK